MQTLYAAGVMWFRRDLRVHDNHALSRALASCAVVHCVFVFDTNILAGLPRADRRVEFIRESVDELDASLRELSGGAEGGLIVLHAGAKDAVPALARQLGVDAVFANHDDEPASLARDAAVRTALAAQRIGLHTFKDHVVFERKELLTQAGAPYSVFTPYRNAWLAKVTAGDLAAHRMEAHASRLAARPPATRAGVPPLTDLGFQRTNLGALGIAPGERGAQRLFAVFEPRMSAYGRTRDFPSVKGPSYLGIHLRFGTISIRALARRAHAAALAGDEGAATWLSELIWRDFYAQVLANFPHVAGPGGESRSFKPAYDAIEWEDGVAAEGLLAAWCEGRTGYPLVDAAMAQINSTGYMHNRLRMVVASFLCKDLGIDWRRGERYFALHLNDYELASNNGGWQWASSSGCDAQPYFRIFNPLSQSRKFDPEGRFIRRYLPQLAALSGDALHAPWTASAAELSQAGVVLGRDYPHPIVDHDAARTRTLERYAVVKTPAITPRSSARSSA
ncbi:cryptochrome/photolyase family protein [Caenimonas aquaedulcis]|uniref:Deoxyribodipyrimidine photo-lyase n=1 Tax=Caenimonas aquaedulcis TaxID=2793270 RepID=A0A931H6L2_9BURK|nr:deoxyribodipyrimidine photo-lyase [Caenimonas aquaedulcis]MBG9389488.1 deoxyribodipyrimidine photo-lyase [Caenimonas aquaedulcis]